MEQLKNQTKNLFYNYLFRLLFRDFYFFVAKKNPIHLNRARLLHYDIMIYSFDKQTLFLANLW